MFSRPVSPSCVCDDVPLVDLDPLPVPPPLAVAAAPLGVLPVAAEAPLTLLLLAVVVAGVSDAAEELGTTGSIMACGVVSTSCHDRIVGPMWDAGQTFSSSRILDSEGRLARGFNAGMVEAGPRRIAARGRGALDITNFGVGPPVVRTPRRTYLGRCEHHGLWQGQQLHRGVQGVLELLGLLHQMLLLLLGRGRRRLLVLGLKGRLEGCCCCCDGLASATAHPR